jgi:hypothetical protein
MPGGVKWKKNGAGAPRVAGGTGRNNRNRYRYRDRDRRDVIEVPLPIAISIPKKARRFTGFEQRFCSDKSGPGQGRRSYETSATWKNK